MSTLQVGDILDDRYRIDTPIARGGMSTVYRCVDLRLGRQVAAKVMHDTYLDDPVFRSRFQREARSMAQLNHPNLVNVYDFSSTAEHAFLIMELITGGTLRELLADRGPMPPHAAAAVMRAVLTGLSVAHDKGLIHRDLKPDNILISADHRVKLADFGLVRAVAESERTSDQIVGTVSYLSPEQVDGAVIGPESDVYSAGIVLFELLTGTLPFRGDTQLAHAMQRLHADVPAPSTRIEGVPKLFDELVAAATHRAPKERFRTASDFLGALEDVAAELRLPEFRVPVPRNSAAGRATSVASLPLGSAEEHTAITSAITPPPETAAGSSPLSYTQVLGPATPAVPAAPDTAVLPSARPEQYLPTPSPPAPAPAAASAPAEHELAAARPAAVSNRSRLKLVIWLAVVGLLLAGVAIGGWWFGSGRYGEIPQVLGLDEAAAIHQVEQAGFHGSVRPQYSNDAAAGAVLGTDPPFGQRAPRGDDVAVLVSSGKPTVPALPAAGDVQRFRQLLAERGLNLAFGAQRYSDTVPVGGVVATQPAIGSYVPVGSTVTAMLSKGVAPVRVPEVAGLAESEARAALEHAGLNVVGIDRAFSAQHKAGTVIEVSPQSGTEVARGTEVRVRVSNAVRTPDVSGKSVAEARSSLEAAGFVVTQHAVDTTRNRAEEVVSQSIAADTLVDPSQARIDLGVNNRVKVASVIGKKTADATRILREQGLTVKIVREGSIVVSQSPRPRSEVSPEEVIEISGF